MCPFSVSFDNSYYCKCFPRVYIAAELKKWPAESPPCLQLRKEVLPMPLYTIIQNIIVSLSPLDAINLLVTGFVILILVLCLAFESSP
jgi:hypothetical protein